MKALRLDDLGASSKRYERHATKWWPSRELRMEELATLAAWLQRHESKATLAITACWVTWGGRLIPYGARFPEQAGLLHQMALSGRVEIACHGLTHCVVGRHRPSLLPWRGNRRWHREFVEGVPVAQQIAQLVQAKQLLEATFHRPVTTLVPPGNVISETVARAALDLGFTVITCRRRPGQSLTVQDDGDQEILHDFQLLGGRMATTLASLSPPYTTVAQAALLGRLTP